MAEIHKLQKNGVTIYPATTTNAVVDPESKRTLAEVLIDGVSVIVLEWNTDLATTRKQVVVSKRKKGVILIYDNPSVGLVNEQYLVAQIDDPNWTRESNWEPIPNKKTVDAINALIGFFPDEFEDISITKNIGYYISPTGKKTASSTSYYSTPIPVQANTLYMLTVSAWANSVSVISECDADGNNIVPIVISSNTSAGAIGGRSKSYFYLPNTDRYIIVSGSNIADSTLKKSIPNSLFGLFKTFYSAINESYDQVENLRKDLDKRFFANSIQVSSISYNRMGLTVPEGGGYYKTQEIGSFYTDESFVSLSDKASDKAFACTKIKLNKGDVITFNVQPLVFGVIDSLIFTDLQDQVIDVVNNSVLIKGYNYEAKADGFVHINYPVIPKSDNQDLFTIIFVGKTILTPLALSSEVESLKLSLTEKDNTFRYIDLFKKAIFIGDSVTEGYIIDTEILGNSPVFIDGISYPSKLGLLTPNLEIINKGHSGESVQGWNQNRFQTEFEDIKDGIDLCIIELGWNQTGSYSWPNSISEFESKFQSDVKNWGDEFNSYITENSVIGNYCQLIKKIQASSPNISIVLIASMGWDPLRAYFIQNIASWANLPFIDVHKYKPDGGDNVHFTAMGYVKKASIIFDNINKVLADNRLYIRRNIYNNAKQS